MMGDSKSSKICPMRSFRDSIPTTALLSAVTKRCRSPSVRNNTYVLGEFQFQWSSEKSKFMGDGPLILNFQDILKVIAELSIYSLILLVYILSDSGYQTNKT